MLRWIHVTFFNTLINTIGVIVFILRYVDITRTTVSNTCFIILIYKVFAFTYTYIIVIIIIWIAFLFAAFTPIFFILMFMGILPIFTCIICLVFALFNSILYCKCWTILLIKCGAEFNTVDFNISTTCTVVYTRQIIFASYIRAALNTLCT